MMVRTQLSSWKRATQYQDLRSGWNYRVDSLAVAPDLRHRLEILATRYAAAHRSIYTLLDILHLYTARSTRMIVQVKNSKAWCDPNALSDSSFASTVFCDLTLCYTGDNGGPKHWKIAV